MLKFSTSLSDSYSPMAKRSQNRQIGSEKPMGYEGYGAVKAKTAKVGEIVAEDASAEGETRKSATKAEIPDTIVSAAASLFRHQGFAATSMQQIAVAVGLTRPTLYYYFRNKEDILGNLVEEIT